MNSNYNQADNEDRQAEELDAFLTAQLNGQTVPAPETLSSSEAELVMKLIAQARKVQPDVSFATTLETELLRQQASATHQENSNSQGVDSMKLTAILSRQVRRFPTAAVTLLAICSVAIVSMPSLRVLSSRLTAWISTATTEKRAYAQALQEFGLTVTADVQEENSDTGDVTARGNASFGYSAAQIQGNANEIRYVRSREQFVLTGDVQIFQRGERLQGEEVTCLVAERQCVVNRE